MRILRIYFNDEENDDDLGTEEGEDITDALLTVAGSEDVIDTGDDGVDIGDVTAVFQSN